jgi:Leucine-rich repeat (LRR) protein
VDFPDEASQVVLSGLHITQVIAEDLLYFSNLARIDMSDNEAPLEPFGCLPALVELDFQCNALQRISLKNSRGFHNLEVLHLSYNCLTPEDVKELSSLLKIRELYLANNMIRSLPPIMVSLYVSSIFIVLTCICYLSLLGSFYSVGNSVIRAK